MKRKFNPLFIIGLLLVLLISTACESISAASTTPATVYGESGAMGEGTARTYAELNADGSPVSLGIVYTQGTLEGLPTEPDMENRCFDVNGNSTLEMAECIGDYELVLSMPPEVTQNGSIPFKWATLNWNPHGHAAPAPPPWAVPHFDFHFYTAERETIQQIGPGTCGELIDCEDFTRAQVPVPAKYMAPDHIDVGAAVPGMGNHLIDPTSPELTDPNQKFTHTWIYGAYDGHIIFYEPMITHDFLLSQPDVCTPLKIPQAWETSGYYPTEYCIRYQPDSQETTVSLEKFVYREAA